MKSLFYFLFFQSILVQTVFSQPCSSIIVTSQAEINALSPCTVVNGYVEIDNEYPGDITDLSYFENIDSIYGSLSIKFIIGDTLDLSGLVYVRDGVLFENNGLTQLTLGISDFEYPGIGIRVAFNIIESLTFLNLDNVGQFNYINIILNSLNTVSMPDLSDVNYLGSVYIQEHLLTNLSIPSLVSLDGEITLELTQLTDLPFLSGLSHIGDLKIYDIQITNLVFLNNLRSANLIEILNAPLLTDISSLENMQLCNTLKLAYNPALSACCFLSGLHRKNAISQIELSDNATGCLSFPDILDTCLDSDNDGITDGEDNCPTVSNASQADLNNNGIGDVCESLHGSDNTMMSVEASDVYIENSARGVILKSPSGYCYRIRIDDYGNVTSIPVDCP